MQHSGSSITKRNIYHALQECCWKKDLAGGRWVYSLMVRNNYESIALLADYLIRLLATYGSLEEANKVFFYVSKPSVYTWTAVISAYVNLGQPHMAIDLHYKMQQDGTKPDRVIFLCVLKACSSIGALQYGRLIHHQVINCGFELDVVVGNTLVDMYAKCGSLNESSTLFHGLPHHTLVSWSALIAGYAQHGYVGLAFDFFMNMQHDGFEPCKGMFLCILKACSCIGATNQGMVIHDQIIRQRHESDLLIGSTLIDLYSKCDCLEAAHKVFKMIPNRNVVSWGALINGYAQHGYGFHALELFDQMQKEGFQPDKFLFSSMLKLCTIMGASGQGQLLHEKVTRSGCSVDTVVGNALIDMYCKCGNLDTARKVLNELPVKDLASWGAMISGYVSHGDCRLAIQCLEDMQKQGFKPDDRIFMSILAACSHAGMLEEGWHHFKAMIKVHGITPGVEHYNCVIDLLGRAGRLNEAADLLHTMSAQPDIIGWRSLLTGCRTFKNIDLGRHCFGEVVGLGSNNASGYGLMSNMYAEACKWGETEKLKEPRLLAGAIKNPCRAWIEVNGKVHEFIMESKCHPLHNKISAKLIKMKFWMKTWGYVPGFDAVIEQASEEEKEDTFIDHCENLGVCSMLHTVNQ